MTEVDFGAALKSKERPRCAEPALEVPSEMAALRLRLATYDLCDRPERGHFVGDIREGARQLGAVVAADIDRYWSASKEASEGPIDVIDMFSGCGGMSAGFRAINGLIPSYRLAMAVDIDPVANRSYKANLGREPLCESISDLARDVPRLMALVTRARRDGHPLVLIGCAPCQGFSSHRNADGEGDVRNPLFTDFAKIAAAIGPDAIVVENVPELLTTRYWPYVQEAVAILGGAGYIVRLDVHNAAEFGVPQERFRAVMVAMRRPFAPSKGFVKRGQFRTVRQAIGCLPRILAGERRPSDPLHYTAGHAQSTIATIRAVPHDGGNRPAHVGPDCLRRVAQRQGKAAYEDIYGRLAWDRPAVTITASARNPASGRFVHPDQDRGLSVREGALLQGFPADYWFAGTLDPQFRQIGNAVPPPFAAYLAGHMLGEILAEMPPAGPIDDGVREPLGTSFSRLIPALKAGRRLSSTSTPTRTSRLVRE